MNVSIPYIDRNQSLVLVIRILLVLLEFRAYNIAIIMIMVNSRYYKV